MGVPYTFATATTSIPLSELDANFNTPVTIGTSTVGLGNTTTSLVGLSNVSTTTVGSTGSLAIQSSSTTAITINSSQQVGIGTTSPVYKLQVSGDYIYSSGLSAGFLSVDTTGGAWSFGASAGNFIINQSGISERMRIDSSGRLLVGVTSAINSCAFGFQSDNYNTNGMVLKNTSSTYNSTFMYFVNSGGNGAGSIVQTASTTVNYGTSSDYRLKENVAPMTGALTTVAQLKPVTYDWISDKTKGQGFIAHELQAIVPDCVTGEKDAVDSEGNPIYQNIDTSFLVATLTAAIQELNATVTAQAAQIAALQAKVGA